MNLFDPGRRRWCAAIAAVLLLCTGPVATAADAPADAGVQTQMQALSRAAASVVGVQAMALEDARSNRTLGRVRGGSGVVIDASGLVLTIGYLILEAEQVQLVTDDDRLVPARVVGYDVATGFGLLQALAPLRIEPAPLGGLVGPEPGAALMIASGGEDGSVSPARLVSRRPFTGYWEYHLDEALYTTPARRDHSGAGLFDPQGRLVGIGSLFLADAAGSPPAVPGNMFVPVNLLQPLLPELISRGTTRASRRAWLGLGCIEADGAIRVVRVNDDSPADVAGLQMGDRILRIDGTEVHSLEKFWKALWNGSPEREVTLDIQRAGQPQTLRVHSVDRAVTLKRAEGV